MCDLTHLHSNDIVLHNLSYLTPHVNRSYAKVANPHADVQRGSNSNVKISS